MANMLAWLTGRQDNTGDPSPIQYSDGQPSLTAYNPPPSEQFSSWLAGLLGAGPNASLAHQNFATGIPSLLAMTPLGIGLSAADYAHARAASDPLGASAAALGMLPAVGGELKAAVKPMLSKLEAAWLTKTGAIPDYIATATKNLPKTVPYPDPTDVALGAISHALDEPEKQAKTLADLAKLSPPKNDTDVALSAIHEALNPGQPDAISGKTHAVVDTPNEAKGWIAKQTGSTNIPITQISTPLPKETKAADLLEAQKKYEAAIAPIVQNLPERAIQQGYTTPAFRGMAVYQNKGVPNPVFNFNQSEHLYSSDSPMLADMYASYLSQHPGWNVPKDAFKEGAQVSPLLLDTSKYHYYDAKGAHWSSSAGNQRGINEARAKGAPGVIVDNVWDEPNSTRALGQPNKVIITFPSGASTVKSRFAERFDPSSPNMLHGLAALAGGGTLAAAAGSNRAEASPRGPHINDVMDTINSVFPPTMQLPLQGTR